MNKFDAIPIISSIEEVGFNSYKVILSPVELGLGHSLANSLRRISLSSMHGASIVEANIDGVLHEYSTVEGVKEDVVEIVSNLRKLAIKFDDKIETSYLKLKVDKAGPITGADFSLPSGVSIVNTDFVIATLTEDKSFSLEAKAVLGRDSSFFSDYDQEAERNIGTINIEPMFSPIEKVSFNVEVKGHYEVVTLNFKTNGTVDLMKVIDVCFVHLYKQIETFVSLEVSSFRNNNVLQDDYDPIIMKSIEELELTVRSAHCLQSENIQYLGDLVQYTESDLMKIPNLGKKSLTEIKQILVDNDLSLGVSIENFRDKVKIYEKSKNNKM